MPLLPLNQVSSNQNIQNVVKEPGQTEFGNFLNNALEKLDNVQKEADKATVQLATGEAPDIHNVMVAMEKANLSFSLAVEVRNKVINAYQEVMRMQI